MARPKKSETNTTSVVDEEKTTEVEQTETPVVEEVEAKPEIKEAQDEEKDLEKPATEKKIKKFGENEKVVIKCIALAGKELSLPTRMVEFDDKGKCEVTGAEANRLLTIPGYELAK